MIFVKRIFDPYEKSDGRRFLVDRLWPRGVTKKSAKVESWLRTLSPSDNLRKWFAHDAAKWEEFQTRYFAELEKQPKAWEPLLKAAREEDITLVFAAEDTEHNNAVALRMFLIQHLRKAGAAGRQARAYPAPARHLT